MDLGNGADGLVRMGPRQRHDGDVDTGPHERGDLKVLPTLTTLPISIRSLVAPRRPARRPVVKLFGNWGWAASAAGLRWFLDEVWPGLDHSLGWACQIAGSGVAQPLPAGVRAVGRVRSVSEFLSHATAVVVPVRSGVGAPLKYAEALASGAPVRARPADYERAGRHARAQVLEELSWAEVSRPLLRWVKGVASATPTEGHVQT